MNFDPPPFPGASLPLRSNELLLRYQRGWAAETAPVACYDKSRRIGISWATAHIAVWQAMEQGAGNVYYMAYNKLATREFMEDCKSVAAHLNAAFAPIIIADADKDAHTYAIKFKSGAEIRTLAATPENFRGKGKPGELLIVDECRDVADFDGVLAALMPTKLWGAKIRLLSSAGASQSAWTNFLNGIREGKRDAVIHRTTFADAMRDGFFRRVCQIQGKEWTAAAEAAYYAAGIKDSGDNAATELFCIPSMDGTQWLTQPLVESRARRELSAVRWQPPANDYDRWPASMRIKHIVDFVANRFLPALSATGGRVHLGVDFARKRDKSVFAVAQLGNDMMRKVNILELHDCPHDAQFAAAKAIYDWARQFAGCGFGGASFDARGNGSHLAESFEQLTGMHDVAINTTEGWYRDNMPPLKAAFQTDMILIPLDKDIIDDLLTVQLQNGIPRVPDLRSTGTDGLQRHADSAIAIAMAYHATRHASHISAADFHSTGRPPRAIGGYNSERSLKGY